MKKIEYNKLSEIIVKSQEELDMIPLDFKGRIYIEFGTLFRPAIINKSYNSSVVAWGNSSVVARGNVQVLDCSNNGKIKISGNARIVYNPKTIHEFMDFYEIKHDKKKAIFYKAVHMLTITCVRVCHITKLAQANWLDLSLMKSKNG